MTRKRNYKDPQRDMANDPNAVIILFKATLSGDELTVSLLDSYNGVRVFHRDHLDPRLMLGRDEPLPYFDDEGLALAYLKEAEGEHRPCMLKAVRAFKVTSAPLADYRPEPHCDHCGRGGE